MVTKYDIKNWTSLSLLLLIFYEIMWFPVDNYKELHIDIPSFGELFIDWIMCACQVVFGMQAIKYEIKKGFVYNWEKLNVISVLLVIILYNVVLAIPTTYIQICVYHLFSTETWNWQDFYVNIMIVVIVSSLLLTIQLMAQYIHNLKEVTLKHEKEKLATAQAKIIALQSQVNPHFLYNSLSVAVGLIQSNTKNAVSFLTDLAETYRHTIRHGDQQLTTLDDEIVNLNRYMRMMHIRFGNSIHLAIDVSPSNLETFIFPGVLQLLAENAIKHNKWSESDPLKINIRVVDNFLEITNNYSPLTNVSTSIGMGLNNIKQRYEAVGFDCVSFSPDGEKYIVLIPIIQDKIQ